MLYRFTLVYLPSASLPIPLLSIQDRINKQDDNVAAVRDGQHPAKGSCLAGDASTATTKTATPTTFTDDWTNIDRLVEECLLWRYVPHARCGALDGSDSDADDLLHT